MILKLSLRLEVDVITKCETGDVVVLRVFGSLSGSSVQELERCWREVGPHNGLEQVDCARPRRSILMGEC